MIIIYAYYLLVLFIIIYGPGPDPAPPHVLGSLWEAPRRTAPPALRTDSPAMLVLGAGRLELCLKLLQAADSEKYVANAIDGLHRVTPITALGRRAKKIGPTVVTYMDHCRDDDGTVHFEKVMDWTMAEQPSWNASASD